MKQNSTIVFSVLLSMQLAAQTLPAKTRSLTTEDGLPQGFITGIVQDKQGFIWLGTLDGLARYDGRSIKVFRHDDADSNTLSGNVIRFLTLDRHNTIWVQYDNGSTDLFNPLTEKIRRLTKEPGFSILVTSRSDLGYNHFVFDGKDQAYRAQGGTIAKLNRLLRVSLQQRKTDTIPLPEGERLVDASNDEQGTIWALTNESLYKVNGNGRAKKICALPPPVAGNFDEFVSIVISNNGLRNEIAILKRKGIGYYHPASRQWRFTPYPFAIKPTGGVQFFRANDGKQYLIADTLIYRLEPDGGFKEIWHNTLRYPSIPTAMVDRTNMLWIGTNTFGARIVDLNETGFQSYPSNRQFFYDVLSALYPIRFGPSRPGAEYFQSLAGRSTIDRNGNLWLANLCCTDVQEQPVLQKSILQFRPSGAKVLDLDTTLVERRKFVAFNLAFDQYNNLWCTTPLSGKLFQVSASDGRLQKTVALNNKLNIPAYLLAADSVLYVLHENAVSAYDPLTNKLTIYKDQPGVKPFSNASLLMAVKDPKQRQVLWLASRGAGLLRFDVKTATVRAFTTKDGLPNNTVYAIVPDRNGYLWCSTNNGIFRFNPIDHRVLTFSEKDGLQGNEFNRYQFLQLPDGRIVFGGTQGWTVFHPDSIRIDNFQPAIAVTDIAIQNEPLSAYPELNKAVASIDTLRLSYNQNFLTFRFAALQFNSPEKLQYRYRLTTFDKDWVNTGNQNTANFTNLPPGAYQLQINATNTASIWSDYIKTITIIITPPWWKTWWAYGLYAIIILSVVFTLFRMQLKQARVRQEAELKRKEAEQLKAVNEIKTRFFSNITHEFRTPLSLIISPAEQLQKDPATPSPVKSGLAIIQRNAMQLLRLINQLLDMSKIESGSMQLSFSRGSLPSFVEDCVQAFKAAAYAKNIRLSVSVSNSETELLFDADKLEKILYNLLSNAIKFTTEGGEVKVLLAEEESNNEVQVHLQVNDTGAGIAPDTLPQIFDRFYQADNSATRQYEGTGIGLALVKELVQLMNGNISVKSELQKGTSFDLVLPLQKATTEAVPRWTRTTLLPEAPVQQLAATVSSGSPTAPLLLVVEDNEELRAFIFESLRPNYRVLTAANGQEAHAIANEELPDLIICDVMMPVMDGYTLCRKLKSTPATEHIAVVLLTAKAAHDSVMEGLGTGADDYITKPFHFDELQLRLHNILERRESLRRFYQAQLRNPEVPLTEKKEEHPFITSLYTIIDEHLDDSTLTVEKLASKAAMSSRTLNRKLSSVVGLSANELIRQYRLRRSIEFLNAGSNVSEAAYSVGFETHSHFTTSFKAFFGLTPSEYLNAQTQ